MFGKKLRNFIPAFIPLIFEIFRQIKRDANHNSKIKKIDMTQEKLNTVENMLVRLENKIHQNREQIDSMRFHLMIITLVTLLLALAIFLKLFVQ